MLHGERSCSLPVVVCKGKIVSFGIAITQFVFQCNHLLFHVCNNLYEPDVMH